MVDDVVVLEPREGGAGDRVQRLPRAVRDEVEVDAPRGGCGRGRAVDHAGENSACEWECWGKPGRVARPKPASVNPGPAKDPVRRCGRVPRRFGTEWIPRAGSGGWAA